MGIILNVKGDGTNTRQVGLQPFSFLWTIMRYTSHDCEWNSPGTPLITSTLKLYIRIPSSLGLSLLWFSLSQHSYCFPLSQCSYCFPLSSKVCCNKQLPELAKFQNSNFEFKIQNLKNLQNFINLVVVHCCSVAQLCPNLCNPMDCSTPGFSVLHNPPEFA